MQNLAYRTDKYTVSVRWVPDEDVDLSWLGEYKDRLGTKDHCYIALKRGEFWRDALTDDYPTEEDVYSNTNWHYWVPGNPGGTDENIIKDFYRHDSFGESWNMWGCIVDVWNNETGELVGDNSLLGISDDSDKEYLRGTVEGCLLEAHADILFDEPVSELYDKLDIVLETISSYNTVISMVKRGAL